MCFNKTRNFWRTKPPNLLCCQGRLWSLEESSMQLKTKILKCKSEVLSSLKHGNLTVYMSNWLKNLKIGKYRLLHVIKVPNTSQTKAKIVLASLNWFMASPNGKKSNYLSFFSQIGW